MEKSNIKIGWIGLGVMGKPLCGFLLQNGYDVSITARDKSKVEELIEKGAKYLSGEELAKTCDIIFLMVGAPKDVKEVIFEKPGLINIMKEGGIIVDHTTSSPSLAEELYAECKKKNIHFMDAPVSGADVLAKQGGVSIIAGGDQEIFDKINPIISCYSKSQTLMGGAGKGLHAKLFAQICLANNVAGVIEGMIYGHKAGLDLEKTFEALKASGASSVAMNTYMPRILKRDLAPTITVELWMKDLELILEESRRLNIVLPAINLIKTFYQALLANGGAKLGFQALILTLEQLNGIKHDK